MTMRWWFLPAALPTLLLGACTRRDAEPPADPPAMRAELPGASAADLTGTSWRLAEMGGAAVLEGVEASLEFMEAGQVTGSGSCNRFFGKLQIAGDTIRFGPFGVTRMACPEAVMTQEDRYLEALGRAERFARDGATLQIHARGLERPLRFVAREP
jgi:heat shock protein HslJ